MVVALIAPALALPLDVQAQSKRSGKATSTETTPLDMRKVTYAELEQHVGDQLLIRTIHDTSRRGTLTRFTNVTLTLKLDAALGGIELSVPRETIRELLLVIAAESPLFPETLHNEGKSGAQKN